MQQEQVGEVSVYADIVEVRMETRAADYKKLLADGWVLLGAYLLTTVGNEYGKPWREQRQKQSLDTQQRVRGLVGYVVGRRRE
jgi:hypothetical protein